MDRRPSPGNTNLESFSNDSVASEDEERILNAEAALLEAGEHRTARPSGFPFLASPRQRASSFLANTGPMRSVSMGQGCEE